MTRMPIQTVEEGATVADAARKMKSANKGCLVVLKSNMPVGIITERDMVQRVIAAGERPEMVQVSKVMSSPLVTVRSEAHVDEAARVMVDHGIRRLVVVDGKTMVGIVTVTDFAKLLERKEGGPLAHAMSRGRIVLSEARNIRRQCPNCGSRGHVEFVRSSPSGETEGREGMERLLLVEAGGQAGAVPGPITAEKTGHVSVEHTENVYRCQKCGEEWKEDHEVDVLLPDGIPIDSLPSGTF